MVVSLCVLSNLRRQRGGGLKGMIPKLTGHAPFEVDESFLLDHIGDQISEDEREIMSMFIDQSQEVQATNVQALAPNGEEDKKKAGGSAEEGAYYYRICDIPPKLCDDSPLEGIECPERITSKKKSVFGHEGQMIHTDGTGRATKLTKVYKRDDNRGWLMSALKRMKLNV